MAQTPTAFSGPVEYTPDPYQPQCKLSASRDANTGLLQFRVTTDGGAAWRTLLPDPGPGVPAGSVLTLGSDRQVGWSRPPAASAAAAASVASYAGSSFFVELAQFGSLYAGQTFGFFQAPSDSGLVCSGVQLSLQSAAVGSGATVCLVTTLGVETVQTASLASGVESGQTLFVSPLTIPAGSGWRARVKAVGSTSPGECLSVRLILSLTA
jgi:hypothetical protein